VCVRTFDRRVVFVHKVTLDELYRQATLAHTTAANHHQLVFPEELKRAPELAQQRRDATTRARVCLRKGDTRAYFRSHRGTVDVTAAAAAATTSGLVAVSEIGAERQAQGGIDKGG